MKAEFSDDSNLLFVYGSLMRGMERADFLNATHKARFLSTAAAPGKLYHLGAFPAMKEGSNGSMVRGELYELLDPQTFFETLDLIEGYWPEQPERSLYVRKLIPVITPEGEKKAWAYLLNLPFENLKAIPSGDYRECAHDSGSTDLE